jgi:hypothetical protein
MDQEFPFDANPTGGHSTDSHGCTSTVPFQGDDNALKNLNSLVLAFHNPHMDPNRITHM